MPSVSLRLTDAQVSWLDAQTRQFRNRSDVLRDLIDSQIGNLTPRLPWERRAPKGGSRSLLILLYIKSLLYLITP